MLLTEDVLIIEGGHAQTTKVEYMGGHMLSDMKFLTDMTSETISQESGQAGDRAWSVTHSRSVGTYGGKEYDLTSREFLLMRREGGKWKIAMIEWADK